MSSEKLYPMLTSEYNDQRDEHQRERLRFMKDKQQQLMNRLEHYKKIKHRWSIMKNVSEGLGVSITVISGVLAIVSTSGILGIPIMTILTTGSGLITGVITTITNKTFIGKRRSSIKKKYLRTKEIVDNLQIYFQKCKQDNIITIEEMEQFESILQKYESDISPTCKTPACIISTSNDNFLDQLESLIQSYNVQSRKSLRK